MKKLAWRHYLEFIAAALLVAACAAVSTIPVVSPALTKNPVTTGTIGLSASPVLPITTSLPSPTPIPVLIETVPATPLSTPTRPAALTATAAATPPPVAGTEPATGQPIPHLTPGQPLTITAIHKVDAANGWGITRDAIGVGHVLRTADGGTGWHDVTPPETAYASPSWASLAATSLSDFLDANTAWIIYWADPGQLNPVWHTRDGGQTWQAGSLTPFVATEPGLPTTLTFVDAQTGWLFVAIAACGTGGCDDHGLYATTDGGHTWQPVGRTFQGGLSDCIKTGVTFLSAQTGWVSGYCSMALIYLLQRTDDGGRTWQSQTLPPPLGEPHLLEFSQSAGCEAAGPVFSSAKAGVLDMYCPWPKDYPVKRWLYFTTDSGQTWVPRQAPTDLGAADFIDADTGWWLSGNEPARPGPTRLYRTTDAGRTWALIKQLAWAGTLDFVSQQVGWAVAQAGNSVALVKTVDGGRTWQVLEPQSR